MNSHRPATRSLETVELRRWYGRHLRPLVARAVRDGRIGPAQAAGLERSMRDLLGHSGVQQASRGSDARVPGQR
jgi:hypothetical protein